MSCQVEVFVALFLYDVYVQECIHTISMFGIDPRHEDINLLKMKY